MLAPSIDMSLLDDQFAPADAQRALLPVVSHDDVALARVAGMDPRDVSALRAFASERFLIVVRCPHSEAAAPEGPRRATPRRLRPRTGAHRVVAAPRPTAPPSCDLVSVWTLVPGLQEPVRIVPRGAAPFARMPLAPTAIVGELNSRLVARVRHAAAADDASAAPAARDDRFVAFGHGGATYLPDATACAEYYRRHGLNTSHDGSER